MSEYVLYDLPSKGRCACWSLNPWKSESLLVLWCVDIANMMIAQLQSGWPSTSKAFPTRPSGLNTQTLRPSSNHCQWRSLQLSARHRCSLLTFHYSGVEPNAEGMPYTIPTVRFSDSEVIMESVKIARALEAKHPEPPLHVDDPIGEEVQKCLTELAMPLFPVMMPQVPRNLLNPSSAEYFRRTREVRFGMPLDEFEKKGGEQSWAAAQAPMEKMAALLKKNGGPFLLGKTGKITLLHLTT